MMLTQNIRSLYVKHKDKARALVRSGCVVLRQCFIGMVYVILIHGWIWLDLNDKNPYNKNESLFSFLTFLLMWIFLGMQEHLPALMENFTVKTKDIHLCGYFHQELMMVSVVRALFGWNVIEGLVSDLFIMIGFHLYLQF